VYYRAKDKHGRAEHVNAALALRAATPAGYNLGMAEPEALMSQQALADYLGVSVATVQRWRREDTGPPWLLVGNRPRYRRAAVDSWLEAQAPARRPRKRPRRSPGERTDRPAE
jgi:excisionase family DNA binding protein